MGDLAGNWPAPKDARTRSSFTVAQTKEGLWVRKGGIGEIREWLGRYTSTEKGCSSFGWLAYEVLGLPVRLSLRIFLRV